MSTLAVHTRKRRLVDTDQQRLQRPQARELSVCGLLERQAVVLADRNDDVWRVFARQEEALQALAGLSQQSTTISSALHLFSHELSGSNGAREFIVSSHATFYRRYMAMPARQRHHYEVIRPKQRQTTPHSHTTHTLTHFVSLGRHQRSLC